MYGSGFRQTSSMFMALLVWYSFDGVNASDKSAERRGVDDIPHFDNGDMVEFYYLEGAFPFTAPDSIVEGSGDLFTSYSLTHAGLGVWNKETHLKLSLELVCYDYLGALLPEVVDNGGPYENLTTLEWNNTATVVLTKPMNESDWGEARLLAVSDGAAFNNLKDWVKDHEGKYSTYQPVRVNPYESSGRTGGDEPHVGEDLIPYSDSYSFLEAMLGSLADYGVKLQTLLDVQTTGFSYVADDSPAGGGAAVSLLEWDETSSPPENVTQWYSDLRSCYEQVWNENLYNGAAFLEEVTVCYEMGFAFVFASPTSVFQVMLEDEASSSEETDTPLLWRQIFDLPEEDDSLRSRWDLSDSLLLIAVVVAVCSGGTYFVYTKILYPPPRRKASIHWEEQATQIVHSMISKRQLEASAASSSAGHNDSSMMMGSSQQGETGSRGQYLPPGGRVFSARGEGGRGGTVLISNYLEGGAERDGGGGEGVGDGESDEEDDVMYNYFNRPTSYRPHHNQHGVSSSGPLDPQMQSLSGMFSDFVGSLIRPSFDSESTAYPQSRQHTITEDTEGSFASMGPLPRPQPSSSDYYPSPPQRRQQEQQLAGGGSGSSVGGGVVWGRSHSTGGGDDMEGGYGGSVRNAVSEDGGGVGSGARDQRALSGVSDDLAAFLSLPSTKVHTPTAPTTTSSSTARQAGRGHGGGSEREEEDEEEEERQRRNFSMEERESLNRKYRKS